MLIACKDAADVSCTIANLLSELELPCGRCNGSGVVLAGTAPTGCAVTIRMLPDNVLDVEGGDELLQAIRERGCPRGG
jgi:hypothetical protein